MWMYMGNLSLRTFFNIFFFIRKFSNFQICLNLVGFNRINSIEFLLNVQNQLRKRFLPSLNTPMACPGLTCLHHRQMQKCQFIFPGYQTQMPLRWMPLLSPGRI